MSDHNSSIVLVHLGPSLPKIVASNVKYLSRTFQREIHLITNLRTKSLSKLKNIENAIHIHNANELDSDWQNSIRSSYRNNFWDHTKKRLYLVCRFLDVTGFARAIHIENDIWLAPYADLDLAFAEGRITYPILKDGRGVGSSIFFDDREKYLSSKMKKYLLEYPDKTDMEILGIMHKENPNEFTRLPSSAIDIGKAKDLYDGAFIGMHMFGEDPRNRFGKYKIRSDYEAFGGKLSELQLYLDVENRLIAESKSGRSVVCSLHVHSKRTDLFTKDYVKVINTGLVFRNQLHDATDLFNMFGFVKALIDYLKLLPKYLKKRWTKD